MDIISTIETGEFSPHAEEAEKMTVWKFSERHGQPVRLWGRPPSYYAVQVMGADYLWKIDTGKYDGWDWCAICQSSRQFRFVARNPKSRIWQAFVVFFKHWKSGGIKRAILFTQAFLANGQSASDRRERKSQ